MEEVQEKLGGQSVAGSILKNGPQSPLSLEFLADGMTPHIISLWVVTPPRPQGHKGSALGPGQGWLADEGGGC